MCLWLHGWQTNHQHVSAARVAASILSEGSTPHPTTHRWETWKIQWFERHRFFWLQAEQQFHQIFLWLEWQKRGRRACPYLFHHNATNENNNILFHPPFTPRGCPLDAQGEPSERRAPRHAPAHVPNSQEGTRSTRTTTRAASTHGATKLQS